MPVDLEYCQSLFETIRNTNNMEKNQKYLYGAAVQGIQSFIFQTNELKDIIGASELVEMICTDFFKEFVCGGELVVSAAGNIKCIFEDEQECRNAVLLFPKKVMEAAPGITISEAVVPFADDSEFAEAVEELENRLRIQRNKPFPSITTGLMGMERSRKTGLPAVKVEKGEFLDKSTVNKRERGLKTSSELYKKFGIDGIDIKAMALNVDDMTGDNSWLAIIHADGNGLGDIVSKIGKDKELLKEFSSGLNKATERACQKAYLQTISDKNYKEGKSVLPFRPIILGGDDLTLICRGDLALPFTRSFIQNFEEQTQVMLGNLKAKAEKISLNKLTACAGIAFIKSSYPFYYGYDLAETLCSIAKKDTKKSGEVPPASCLMFHKVQSSFIEDFNEIVKKELTPCPNHSFVFGPYYLAERPGRWTVDELLEKAKKLNGKAGNAVKSDIRQWMTLMSESINKAEQKEQRVKDISSKHDKDLFESIIKGFIRNVDHNCIQTVHPAYDTLVIHTINNQII